jgi:hypothetical protein
MFKALQFVLVSVNLYRRMVRRQEEMVRLLLDIRDNAKSFHALSDEEQSAYFSKIEIRGLKFVPASSTTGEESPAFISGVIKNNGDRTVTRVRALLLLLDAEGRSCHEYNFSPVITVEGEDRFRPLRPNHSLSFLVEIKDPPSTWDGRTYRIKWISLEFE